jgi:hypothetical protein
MTKLILKAVSSPKSAASAAVDQVVGQVDTASGAQRLSISAQANTQYRLVDSKTGQVIKNQTVLRKGKTLQIEVEGKNLVELDNFFPNEASDAAPQAPSATYLVDTNGNADTTSDAVISNVAINGDAVVLTLSPNTRVQEGQKISVSYTDPTANNDLFAVQDATGNDAVSFTRQNVVNKVSANPPVIKVEPGQVFTYTERVRAWAGYPFGKSLRSHRHSLMKIARNLLFVFASVTAALSVLTAAYVAHQPGLEEAALRSLQSACWPLASISNCAIWPVWNGSGH